MCSLIPETLEGVDLDVIGCHRQCYQQFTKNQDRLKQLPPECIYCDTIEIKTAGKTERPTKFTLASAWEPIESQAKMLEKTNLARKVSGFDLCSVEEKHHASCHWGFKNEHHNFIRTQVRVKASRADTEQTHITAAHNEAFDSALQFVQEHIIQQSILIETHLY